MLYDFFNQSLHRKVEEFGHDVSIFNIKNKNFTKIFQRMKKELKKIKKLYSDCAKNGCKEKRMFPAEAKNLTGSRYVHEKLKASEYLKIMEENFGSCENPGNPYQQVKIWRETDDLTSDCGTAADILRNIERD